MREAVHGEQAIRFRVKPVTARVAGVGDLPRLDRTDPNGGLGGVRAFLLSAWFDTSCSLRRDRNLAC
jgi:hypothetical protein